MGEHSVLLTDEDQHLRARKLLMPAFNGASLRRYGALVHSLAHREVQTWRSGSTISALDRMNGLTLEIILQVVFGVTDEQRLARLRPRVTAVVDIGTSILLGWMFPRCCGGDPGARTRTTWSLSTGSSTPRSRSGARCPTSPRVTTCSRGCCWSAAPRASSR
jgi:cytochrome P450